MRSVAPTIIFILLGASCCVAQDKPTEKCSFPDEGFAQTPGQKLRIAEVAARATTLMECDSPKGCIALPEGKGTPVIVYGERGGWTCGYFSSREGAGPAWIRSDALRVVSYSANPPVSSWFGTWIGGEDRVLIRPGTQAGTLHFVGSAVWKGRNTAHFGDMQGVASPVANHLHFLQDGPGSCTIDMTLMGRYIEASDNQACGGLNARFQGIWKRKAQ